MFWAEWIDVVAMGRYAHLAAGGFLRDHDQRVVNDCMQQTGTLPLKHRRLSRLSGGERKRVLLASVLAQEPRVLLLDEPTSALDLHHQVRFFAILTQLAGAGLSVVVVTHDMNLASLYCHRMVLMSEGRIVREGAPEDLVLSGDIGAVFDQQNVVFDPDSGDFVVNLPHKDEVVLLASGRDGLWTLRALQRAGYRVVFEAAEGKPLIEGDVHQKPTIWRVRHLHKSLESHSIYQLLQNLRGLLNS